MNMIEFADLIEFATFLNTSSAALLNVGKAFTCFAAGGFVASYLFTGYQRRFGAIDKYIDEIERLYKDRFDEINQQLNATCQLQRKQYEKLGKSIQALMTRVTHIENEVKRSPLQESLPQQPQYVQAGQHERRVVHQANHKKSSNRD